ncbi:hypothetical protein [Hyalangium sp.]|uniref:hypothetical protein n=1 Tax=Hyalangium sp. TaxID=2028555 RepID=UPI002D2A6E65|nr:hypothetical protein [Hyalangium sp.]HYH98463.1 hypothetical protein [Hyalangium sp.]
MRSQHDRRDLACLGLTVLVYGLVVAPVLHAAVDHAGGRALPATARGWLDHPKAEQRGHGHLHGDASGAEESSAAPGVADHGHEHEHSQEPTRGHPHRHQWGSVEHLQAVAVAGVGVLAPVVGWVPLGAEVPQRPQWASVAPLRPTAMPQGP